MDGGLASVHDVVERPGVFVEFRVEFRVRLA